MTALILSALLFACAVNAHDLKRWLCSVVVLSVTCMSYLIYESSISYSLVSLFGYYGDQSIAPLLSIAILYFIKQSRLAICLIWLFGLIITINVVSFSIEWAGIGIDYYYQSVIMMCFVIEIVLMFSPRATNGLYQFLSRFNSAGDTAETSMAGYYLDNSPKNPAGEAEK